MAKAHCPACSARMRAKDKHCSACGQRSPLFPPEDAQAAKAVRPVLVKAARPATVTEIRRVQLLREIQDEPDPGRREVFTGQLVALMKGNVP
jgi:hypothetical protein